MLTNKTWQVEQKPGGEEEEENTTFRLKCIVIA